jgi:cytochrome c
MFNKTSLMITVCSAAAMCLSACGPKPEDTASNVPGNSVASAGMTPAPAASASTGDATLEASAGKVGVTPTSGDEASTKAIKTPDPVKTDTTTPAKTAAVKVPQPVVTPAPVAQKTAVAAVRPASFGQCAVCHSDKQGQKSGFGPNLFGIVGTKAGAVPGYAFSPAMTASGVQWNRENLDAYLLSPQSKIPGTKMSFSGVKDAAKRKEIVDYLLGLK